MSLHIQLTLLCIISATAHSQTWEHTVYIDSTNGEDSAACLTNGTGFVPCATLEFVFAGITHSTHVVLRNGHHIVSTTLQLLDLADIALSGDGANTTVVECIAVDSHFGAGLKFVRATRLSLHDMKLTKCGSLLQSTTQDINGTSLFRAGVYVLNSTDVSISRVRVSHNKGTGLVLYDVSGAVTIESSTFIGNTVPADELDKLMGGGGLYIEHTYCTPGMVESDVTHCDLINNPYSSHSSYRISRCVFSGNHGNTLANRLNIIFYQEKSHPNRLGSGGGLAITLSGVSLNNSFDVTNCSFKENSAVFGGGLSVHLHDQATKNTLLFKHCVFEQNSADYGGGGFSIGYFFYDTERGLAGNAAIFESVNVSSNSARFGGGTEIVASRTRHVDSVTNSFRFSNCTWMSNIAPLAAALILAPEPWNSLTDGHLPEPVFADCKFIQNSIVYSTDGYAQSSKGILFSSTFSMNFSSLVLFHQNNGSAISINAGSINVLPNATANFTQNTGSKGGAIALLEFAHLRVFPNSVLVFDSNVAYEVGGAIYAAATDELDFYVSRSCFIHYHDVLINVKNWDTKIIFKNNRAGPLSTSYHSHHVVILDQPDNSTDERGQSIYSVSILPCWRAADTSGDKSLSLADIFPHPFEFSNIEPGTAHIATAPSSLEIDPEVLDSEGRLHVVPGEVCTIPIIARDDLNNSVNAVYRVYVSGYHMTLPDSVEVDCNYEYITNNTIQVNGAIGAKFRLNIRTVVGHRTVQTSVNATLTDCPPGLIWKGAYRSDGKCVCSATTSNTQYEGITKCSTEGSYGLLNKGYWAGCNDTGAVLTSECPLGYCRSELSNTASTKPLMFSRSRVKS